jgi:KDO2-lipid IV(A) lauroyltransferase
MITLTAHIGNWEFCGIAYCLLARQPMLSVMRPFDNPRIGKMILEKRTRDGHRMSDRKGALKALLGALRKGESVGLLVDQHAGSAEGVETVFFGHPARTHASPAMLHLKTGVPIVVGVLRRTGLQEPPFELALADLIRYSPTGDKENDIRNVTQLYTSQIESMIRETPEQWLWAHRRWLNINRKRRTA